MKNIEINGFGKKEMDTIAPIMKDLLTSYMQKSNDVELVDWLKSQLKEHLSDKTPDVIDQISSDIISKIDKFNSNLMNMEQYCSKGKVRQEWFYNQIKEIPEGMDISTYGNYLSQVENGLAVGNQSVINASQLENGGLITLHDIPNYEISNVEQNGEWNKYTLRNVASNIVKQADLAGLGNITMPVGMNLALQATQVMDMPKLDVNMEEIELNSAIDTGIKTVATTALEICLNKGKVPFLNKFIPIGLAADVACLGVESVKAIARYANGQASARQTVECLGMATTSALVNFISSKVAISMCSAIPVIGPVLGTTLGALVMSMSSQQIEQCIYSGIQKLQPIAVSMLNTAHDVLTSGVNFVKDIGNEIISLLEF